MTSAAASLASGRRLTDMANGMSGTPGAGGAGGGLGLSTGMPTGMGWAAAAARRKAVRQTMKPIQVKHGLVAAPHIQHPRDNTGPSFGQGGGFKAGGF